MAGQSVNLPAVGPVSRRALLIGGGLSAVVVGVVWWRRRQSAAAAAPADTSDPNAVDDLSGLDAGGGGAGGGGGGGSSTSSSTTPASNPQWTQQVMQLLGGVVDPSALSAALGLYLTGSAVTHDQELIIDQAIAAAGYPPVSGPNGYPPAIRQSPATGQTPPAAGTPAKASVLPGYYVDQWITDLQRHGTKVTWSQLLALNPGIWSNIRNEGGQHGTSAQNRFIHAATYTLPPQ